MEKPLASYPLTVVAIAMIAASLTTAFHESIHALACPLLGGQLKEFSALHVDCATATVFQEKGVAGSASIANLVLGLVSLWFLNRTAPTNSRRRYFWWLFTVMIWLSGTGYWMFSGIANIGDWATVIECWQPHMLWRMIMAIGGTISYLALIWYALLIFGQMVGGQHEEKQIARANRLTVRAILQPFWLASLPHFLTPMAL